MIPERIPGLQGSRYKGIYGWYSEAVRCIHKSLLRIMEDNPGDYILYLTRKSQLYVDIFLTTIIITLLWVVMPVNEKGKVADDKFRFVQLY